MHIFINTFGIGLLAGYRYHGQKLSFAQADYELILNAVSV